MIVNPFPASWEAGAALVVPFEAGWLSFPSPELVSTTDDSFSEVSPLFSELPPKLKEHPARAPMERIETNKVFLFIFLFRGGRPLLSFLNVMRVMKAKSIRVHV